MPRVRCIVRIRRGGAVDLDRVAAQAVEHSRVFGHSWPLYVSTGQLLLGVVLIHLDARFGCRQSSNVRTVPAGRLRIVNKISDRRIVCVRVVREQHFGHIVADGHLCLADLRYCKAVM